MARLLPIGIQDFVSLREDNCVYVDKTHLIHRLVTGAGRVFFLSRPRRFGKSLLCSTLKALFEGRRDLFAAAGGRAALAIDSLDWDWKPRPVVHIDLNPGDYAGEGAAALREIIRNTLAETARLAGLASRGETLSVIFSNLLTDLHEKTGERAAVIIDEYDKPLLNTIGKEELHEAMRNALKAFYGVLKSSDAHLRFVLLTGVSKFAQVSVFSDLNNIFDISFDPDYAALCGVTQEELERDFAPEIDAAAASNGLSRDAYLEEARRFYNGYRFSLAPVSVYNPFGLLNHFCNHGAFQSYWYGTGTPTFLINMIKGQRVDVSALGSNRVNFRDFQRTNTEDMRAVPLLYQTGYLTITGYDTERKAIILDYPNEEVRWAFAKSLTLDYLKVPDQSLNSFISRFQDAVFTADIDSLMETFKALFASVQYDLIRESENYYQTVIHLVFTLLGIDCRSEVRIAAGRIDTLVETEKHVICFEFKLKGSAETALKQIDSKEYLLPWTGSGKRLVKVGVSFNHKKRNIGAWKISQSA